MLGLGGGGVSVGPRRGRWLVLELREGLVLGLGVSVGALVYSWCSTVIIFKE